jgi:hypothetical protein
MLPFGVMLALLCNASCCIGQSTSSHAGKSAARHKASRDGGTREAWHMAIIVNLARLHAWVPCRSMWSVPAGRGQGLGFELEFWRQVESQTDPASACRPMLLILVSGGGSCCFLVGRRCRNSLTEGTADRPPSRCNWPGELAGAPILARS